MQAKAIGAPGKTSPAIFAFTLSKASAPELHQKNMANPNPQNQNPLLRILTRGFWPSADFFGASSVASALDLRRGRDPVTDRSQSSMRVRADPSKPELSTLQKTGTFYFALTVRSGWSRSRANWSTITPPRRAVCGRA